MGLGGGDKLKGKSHKTRQTWCPLIGFSSSTDKVKAGTSLDDVVAENGAD